MSTETPWYAVRLSSRATGGSFTGVTVTFTVRGGDEPAFRSAMVKVNESGPA